MSTRRARVSVLCGGRGAASINGALAADDDVALTVIVNGYDNGKSTGAIRALVPGMLGPSDFRKNVATTLPMRGGDSPELSRLLEYRLSATNGAQAEVDQLLEELASERPPPRRAWGDLARVRVDRRMAVAAAMTKALTWLPRQRPSTPIGTGGALRDCAVGNLVMAGCYLLAGGDFNAAVARLCAIAEPAADVLNVTDGTNAFLVGIRADGEIVADEAQIVEQRDRAPLIEVMLLAAPIDRDQLHRLTRIDATARREWLDRRRVRPVMGRGASAALHEADMVVLAAGTQHSSLLPSYMTIGLRQAIAASAAVRVLLVNIAEDNDIVGLTALQVVDRALSVLGDPDNRAGTLTHVVVHHGAVGRRPAGAPGLVKLPPRVEQHGQKAGLRGCVWVAANLENPGKPGTHDGDRTRALLAELLARSSEARQPTPGAVTG